MNNNNAFGFEDWNFEKKELFEKIPEGKYRVLIKGVEKKISQKGYKMIVIKLLVSGFTKEINHYIVFLPQNPDITNRNLTNLFEGFGIPYGNYNLNSYVGKVGAAEIKLDDQGYEKIRYFITKQEEKDKLPAFINKENNATATLSDEETERKIAEAINELF